VLQCLAEVWGHLLFDLTGQQADGLARSDSGTHQDDLVDLLGLQLRRGSIRSQHGLAGTSRSCQQNDGGVTIQIIKCLLLILILRRHRRDGWFQREAFHAPESGVVLGVSLHPRSAQFTRSRFLSLWS
jgi:hypothetical protein